MCAKHLGSPPEADLRQGRLAVSPESLVMKKGSVWDHAAGLLLGLAVGDATGGPLEFEMHPSESSVAAAMNMGGGGPHRLAPGQVTDDTELAIAVADGLATCAGFSADGVAQQMHKWFLSHPFDMGTTTGRACARGGHGAVAMRAAASSDSLSNGSLMRCGSLALLFGSSDEVMAVAEAHATLTHSRPEVAEAEACFLVAAGCLVQTCGDVGAAVEAARLFSQCCREVVRTWVQEALDVNVPLPPCGPQGMGSVEHGLRRALRHLVMCSSLDAAIAEVIREGYDTDTNAAIVGCMLGARDGLASMPRALWEPVVACDTRRGRPRPLCYHPARLPVLAARILSA